MLSEVWLSFFCCPAIQSNNWLRVDIQQRQRLSSTDMNINRSCKTCDSIELQDVSTSSAVYHSELDVLWCCLCLGISVLNLYKHNYQSVSAVTLLAVVTHRTVYQIQIA